MLPRCNITETFLDTMRRNPRKFSLIGRCAIIVILATVMCFAIAPFAWYLNGVVGVGAMALAALLCLMSALAALCVNQLFNSPKQALMGILLGMMLGMGIPLMLGAAIHLYGGPLSKAGFIYYLLMFYLPTLCAKTILSLPEQKHSAIDNHDP
jgi:hypothetical protein